MRCFDECSILPLGSALMDDAGVTTLMNSKRAPQQQTGHNTHRHNTPSAKSPRHQPPRRQTKATISVVLPNNFAFFF
jgi:hypothetical protein